MEIFKLFGSIMVDNSKANESISKTDGKAKGLMGSLGSGVKTAAKWGTAIVGAAAAGGAALFGMANSAAGTTDRIDKLSQKIGLSREAFQEWDFICSQSGTDVEKLQTGLKTLNGKMADAAKGTGQGAESFKKLGISVTDATGSLKSQEQVFEETVSALQKMPDGAEKARLATELFGKSGQELMPLLNGAAGSVEELKAKAHELGLVLNDEAIDSGVKFTDTIDQLKRSFGSVATKIGVSVMPVVQKFADWINASMPTIQAVLDGVFKGIEYFVTGTITVITGAFDSMNLSWDGLMQGLKNLWDEYGQPLFESIRPLIEALRDNFGTIMETMKLHFQTMWEVCQGLWESIGKPIFEMIVGLVGTVSDFFAERMPAITGFFSQMATDISILWQEHLQPCFQAIGDFINNVLAPTFEWVFNNVIGPIIDGCFKGIIDLWNNSLKPIFENIIDFITNVFTGNWSAAWENVIGILKGIWDGAVAIIKVPFNAIIGMVNKLIDGINSFEVPDFIPFIGGASANISRIPMLYKGTDYFEGGVAMVGEQGPELVEMPRGAKVNTADETRKILGNNKTNDKKCIIQFVTDSRVWAEATANASDLINGTRINLTERGLII